MKNSKLFLMLFASATIGCVQNSFGANPDENGANPDEDGVINHGRQQMVRNGNLLNILDIRTRTNIRLQRPVRKQIAPQRPVWQRLAPQQPGLPRPAQRTSEQVLSEVARFQIAGRRVFLITYTDGTTDYTVPSLTHPGSPNAGYIGSTRPQGS